MHKSVKLVLSNGSEFKGYSFGAERSVAGELGVILKSWGLSINFGQAE